MSSTEIIGDNIWEKGLYGQLISRIEDERGLLDTYQQAADESHSAAFCYLVSLIVDEECRHRVLFAELARTLQTEIERGPEALEIPRLGHWGFEKEQIASLTQRLLDQERQDAEQLRSLGQQLTPVKDTTMWQLLVRLMEADTDKHIEILEFVESHVTRRWHPSEVDWAAIEQTPLGGDHS